jgi:hypothetical protein
MRGSWAVSSDSGSDAWTAFSSIRWGTVG